jgi:hypothetical protein
MDKGTTINYDIEEKEINLGLNLILQQLMPYNEELQLCEQEHIHQLLQENFRDFKMLFNHHNFEIMQVSQKVEKMYQQLSRHGGQTMRQLSEDKNENRPDDVRNNADMPLIDLMFLNDKNTQKPLWVDNRFSEFKAYVSQLESQN